MWADRCTCPTYRRDPADDYLCGWCEDAPRRELDEAHLDGECPSLEELEDDA